MRTQRDTIVSEITALNDALNRLCDQYQMCSEDGQTVHADDAEYFKYADAALQGGGDYFDATIDLPWDEMKVGTQLTFALFLRRDYLEMRLSKLSGGSA